MVRMFDIGGTDLQPSFGKLDRIFEFRGTGDRADDFRRCQKIYHAALGYYDSLEYRLLLLGDVEAVRKIHAWAHPLTLETGNQELSSQCDLAYGWIRVQEHDYTQGIKLISRTLAARPADASNYYRNFYLSVLADSCLREGRHKENQEFLRQAHQDADATGEHWWKAELHRLDGQTYLLNGGSDVGKACKCFQQALDKSRAQGAKILELRAASDMSRLLRNQGNQRRAYDLLAPVYEWFTEGFETTDLRDAKALLDELS